MVAPGGRFSRYNQTNKDSRFVLWLLRGGGHSRLNERGFSLPAFLIQPVQPGAEITRREGRLYLRNRPLTRMLRLPRRTVVFLTAQSLFYTVPRIQAQSHAFPRVQAIRFWSFGDVTRVAIQTQGEYKLTSDQIDNPSRLYFDLTGLRPPSVRGRGIETIPVGDQRVKQIRVAEVSPGRTRVVFDLQGPAEVVSSQLVNPDRLMVEIRPKGTTPAALSVARNMTASKRVAISEPDSSASDATDTGATVTRPVANSGRPPLEAVVVPDGPGDMSTVPPPPHVASAPVTEAATQGVSTVINSTTDRNRPPSASRTNSKLSRDPQITQGSPVSVPKLQTAASVPDSFRTGGAVATLTPARVSGAVLPAKRDSVGDRSLVRVFGLKLGKVVIDPGHGGHDTGTIGPNGLMEKDLALDVALRLGKLINRQLGAEVVYTRAEDVFIPLEERTRIANNEKADLFISIHANSSPESTATGVETYYFNLTSDQRELDLATRENATALSSISDLNDLLHQAVLQTKRDESREFAQRVQASLWSTSLKMNNRSRDRGVRQAPFVVLIGATMPSILAEIGFVSNPHDEKLLKRSEQRQKVAEALFKGISQYANSLSHVQIARAATD